MLPQRGVRESSGQSRLPRSADQSDIHRWRWLRALQAVRHPHFTSESSLSGLPECHSAGEIECGDARQVFQNGQARPGIDPQVRTQYDACRQRVRRHILQHPLHALTELAAQSSRSQRCVWQVQVSLFRQKFRGQQIHLEQRSLTSTNARVKRCLKISFF